MILDNLRECKNYVNAVTHPVTGKQMEHYNLINDPVYELHWTLSKANESERLAQGVGKNKEGKQRVKGMDACNFIFKHQVEKGKTVTYARTVCIVRLEKEEQNQTRTTIGGNLLDYSGEKYTDTAGLELVKMHW